MHRTLLSAVLPLSILLSALAVHAASYTFTTLNVPGARGTRAFEINDSGQIVGWFSDGTRNHGFLTDGATFTTIDVPGAMHTFALGINTAGQIVGEFFGGTTYHAFLTDGVTFSTIDVPDARATHALGINDSGQIVGGFRDGTRDRGFLTDGATFTPIDGPGATGTSAFRINDSGEIVGWFIDATGVHGFLTDGVAFTPIDGPGTSYTLALGINDSGQIVGGFTDATGDHGFVATPGKVDTTPPVMTVSASPATLWPPNGKLVAVTVSGTITDEPGGSGVQTSSAAYSVMDEYGQIQPSGSFILGAGGSYSFTVALQASRNENDRDGRYYMIAVSAKDNAGNRGAASATVTVPHNY